MDLNLLTVASTRAAIEQRSVTASALVDDFYKKIAVEDGEIHAYITLSKERAQAKAAAIDALADKGAPLPPARWWMTSTRKSPSKMARFTPTSRFRKSGRRPKRRRLTHWPIKARLCRQRAGG